LWPIEEIDERELNGVCRKPAVFIFGETIFNVQVLTILPMVSDPALQLAKSGDAVTSGMRKLTSFYGIASDRHHTQLELKGAGNDVNPPA